MEYLYVCIIQNFRKEVVKIPDFSRYMLLDLNIQFFGSLASWVECSPMVRETCVQSQVVLY